MVVDITYCVPCGYLPRAEEVQHALLTEFGGKLEAVALRTGDSGVFTIAVDGDVVYAKPEEFSLDELTARVRTRLSAAA